MTTNKILIVDDEPYNLEILEEILDNKYEVITAENGEECIVRLETERPDLILMDVNMPICNGIEACKEIKANPGFADIPIIFVSALASIEEKMAGYKAGGEDYITKPFDEEELLIKIALTLTVNTTLNELKQNSSEANSIAMTAMSTAGGVGIALRFSQTSFQCKTADELAQVLLDCYTSYGLVATIRYVTKEHTKLYSQLGGKVSITEQEIMEMMRKKGRFVDFGKRTLRNYDHISVLIKNMPIEDEAAYGQIKDNLSFVGDAAEARAKSLEIEMALSQVLVRAKEILLDVDQIYKENAIKNDGVLSLLHSEMEQAFQYLEMAHGDEDRLLSILVEAENKTQSLYSEGLHIEEKIAGLMNEMEGLV